MRNEPPIPSLGGLMLLERGIEITHVEKEPRLLGRVFRQLLDGVIGQRLQQGLDLVRLAFAAKPARPQRRHAEIVGPKRVQLFQPLLGFIEQIVPKQEVDVSRHVGGIDPLAGDELQVLLPRRSTLPPAS